MRKPVAASYYDRREAGRLLGAYRLLEAVLGEDAPDDGDARRDARDGREARRRAAEARGRRHAMALGEVVGR